MEYRLSFTGAYFLFNESLLLAREYTQSRDWNQVKEKVMADNLLQTKTRPTAEKRWKVLQGRISTLTDNQLQLLCAGDIQTQRYVLLLAIAKYHRLIREFLTEVLRRKFLLFDYELLDSDFTIFFREKRALHPQLEKIKEGTEKKLKVVLYHILADCGILSDLQERRIYQPFLSPVFIQTILEEDPRFLAIFLYSDADILSSQQQYDSRNR